MKTKEQRYKELYNSGLVNSIKQIFANRSDISEDYYVLMADYIDSMNEIKDQMLIDPTEVAKKMPELVKSIQETNLGGIYGRTDNNRIQMEQSLDYENKKLYFFHELTHALQTSHSNNVERCGFYDGHDGMFLTEGATQYTAEILYNVSNGTNLEYRQQPRTVRGADNRIPNSPLSEYQYNGNILELMAKSMDLPLPQVLSLAYKKDGRETLKNIYESMEGNQGKFAELMNNLEQIYSIDNLLIHGYEGELQSQTPINITMQDRTTSFKGNISTYRNLMDQTERDLIATYLENHNTEYISQNYKEIAQFLTTSELRNNFIAAVQELTNLSQNIENNNHNNIEQRQPVSQQKEEKMSIKQKVAQFLQKNNLFKNMSFVDKFIHKQLDVLPTQNIRETSIYEEKETAPTNVRRNRNMTANRAIGTRIPDAKGLGGIVSRNKAREDFINQLTNFGAYRNLPPVQRMSDPQKLEEMRRKMEENEQNKQNDEYLMR